MVEGLAERLLGLQDEIRRIELISGHVNDFPGEAGPFDGQTVRQALRGSKGRKAGEILAELASEAPGNGVVELGTNLGISSAYLWFGSKSNNSTVKLATGDISGKRLNFARQLHRNPGIDGIRYVEGPFSSTVDQLFSEVPNWGLAFLDGDHTYESTLKYTEKALATLGPRDGFIVLDDIDWSEDMEKAWREIKARFGRQCTDFGYGLGLIRVD